VAAGQLSREHALKDLKVIAYSSITDLECDKDYFLKKMGWTHEDLEDYLVRPKKAHSDYPSEKSMYDWLLNSGSDRYIYNYFKAVYKKMRTAFRKYFNYTDFTTVN
jgi:hypothetical protein